MARVLVVDDSEFMRSVLASALRRGGHETVAAVDGGSAVEVYKSSHPDLVTMDITMPDVDGLEAASAILKLDPDARIVMCTALNQEAIIRRAVSIGVAEFLTKPFDPEKILSTVNRVLGEA